MRERVRLREDVRERERVREPSRSFCGLDTTESERAREQESKRARERVRVRKREREIAGKTERGNDHARFPASLAKVGDRQPKDVRTESSCLLDSTSM